MQEMNWALMIVLCLVALLIGAAVAGFLAYRKGVANGAEQRKQQAEAAIGSAEKEAGRILEDAKKEAEAKRKNAMVEAKDEIYKLRSEAEKEIKDRRSEIGRQERRIQQKEENLDKKTDNLDRKEESLKQRLKNADRKLAEAEEVKESQLKELERISGLTQDQAKEYILNSLDSELVHEKAVKISYYEQQIKDECEEKARSYISLAIAKCAADQVSETAVSVVALPNDEMKGRIIGREGRNIRTLETLTGVDIIIDDTPETIALSCFDHVRREVARIALEKLIADGRIHPTKIEEMVEKARREVEHRIRQEGERAVLETNVHGLNNELVKLLGRLYYRTSYRQNVLMHSIEVSKLCGVLASELGVDANLARRAGLLHDIGKALTAEIDTIDAAALQPGEEKTLQERKNVITHAQSILAGITAAHLALAGDEDGEQAGAADLLGGAVDGLQNSARLDESLTAMSERLNDLYYSARELATDLADRLDAYGFDAGELDQIETRLDTIYRIKQKFGMEVDELLARREAAAAELETFQSSGQKIAELKAQMQTLYAAAKEAAEKLTQSRLKGFAAMNKEMKAALEFLNMPGIRFALKHTRGPLSSHGQDTVEFLISTNPGEEPKPLAKIASGGELSRIMLAFKSALADRDALPTVIYDEIDTGVSGLAAGRIGQLLHQTARGHQVLCITHTPQVAAFADNQLLIQKNVRKDRTFTEIHTLDMDGRVEVLARMISGDKVSELSLASARELIEKSK